MFLASRGGNDVLSGVGQFIGAPGGPVVSGAGGVDGRAQLDGAGWTVSTGRSAAYGANLPRSPSVVESGTIAAPTERPSYLAGGSPVFMLALALIAGGLILRRLNT